MDEQTAARLAGDVVTALIAGDARKASARFSATMRKGLPPERLVQVWQGFVGQHGAPTARGNTDVARRGDHWVAAVRVAFERAPADVRVTLNDAGQVEGLYLVPSQTPAEQVRAASRLRAGLIASIPLMFGVLAAYVWIAGGLDVDVAVGAALVGAGGWALALTMRGPVLLLARRRPDEAARTIVVASSGPLEEGVRLGALAVTGSSLATAYSVGLGWAAIEVVYALINAYVALTLAGRDDERSEAIRNQLAMQGALRPSTALWSVAERASATAFHIGATLLIAHHPLLLLVTIPLHSGLNLVAVRLTTGSTAKAQAVIAAVGLGTLAAAFLVRGGL